VDGSSIAAALPRDRSWQAPVSPVLVVRGFDPPVRAWLPGHRGVDLHTSPGSTVRAAGAGRVTYAGVLAGRGVVVVDHGTLRTTYEPVDAAVVPGQHVARGEPLGRIGLGTGHCGTGACLHLGLRRGDAYLDPRLVLARGRAVLRPW
jgi:murein DD-endopeptidase MepM/ murein hydrolase activator NlpD